MYLQLYLLIILDTNDVEINYKLIQTEIKSSVKNTLCSFFEII